MPNLYLTEQGSKLRKTGDRLIAEKDDAVLQPAYGGEKDKVRSERGVNKGSLQIPRLLTQTPL